MRTLAVVAVAVTALVPAASASADTNHGTFDGYTYVSDSTVIPGPSAGTIEAACPAGRIHASKPHDDTDADTAANDDWDMGYAMEEQITRTVYVICI